jgi:DNA topoisomerase-1
MNKQLSKKKTAIHKLNISRKNIVTTKKSKKVYKFKYYDGNNNEIKNTKTIDRINKFRIPPGYKNVKISSDPNSKIQAIGVDDKNRKQYIYHPEFVKTNEKNKYNNIIKLGDNVPKIMRKMKSIINKNVNKKINVNEFNKDTKDVFVAIIIFLLSNCNFRIGNIKYVKLYDSYGATTLKKKHIKIKNNFTYIEFIGKKGVLNTAIISDKKITSIIKELIRTRESNDFIFSFKNNQNPISNDIISDFLKSYNDEITPKMFRTWYANNYLLEKLMIDVKKLNPDLIKLCEIGKNPKYIKNCCEYVAERLHNSANISKKSYLDTEIMTELVEKPCEFIDFLMANKNKKTSEILIKLFDRLH